MLPRRPGGGSIRIRPRVIIATNLVTFVERSLKNLGVERIDLLQLHCPPNDVYYNPDVFQVLEDLVAAGKVAALRRERQVAGGRAQGDGLSRIVQSVQIIFNMFRLRPAELFFAEAKRRRVGILARVPLASGLLSGKLTRQSTFAADDHRQFNRRGEAFDVGETFAGVDYETGLAAVEEVKKLCPAGMTLAQFALRWILMFDAVTCAIPGAKQPAQAEENCAAADLPAIPGETMEAIRRIYDERIRAQVHRRW